jgi:hypothetical protein
MIKRDVLRTALYVTSLIALSSCEKGGSNFSLSSTSSKFEQSAVFVPRQLDVLFVVDNSGSMKTSQTNLAQNFPSFINYFKNKGYDFKIAVTTTDAFYGDQFINEGCSICNLQQTQFRASADASGGTPVRVLDNTTPDLEHIFSANVQVGINGSGDERAFSSFKAALNSSLNTGFHRSSAYLSVIIVSDSDDFSQANFDQDETYTNPDLHTVQSYVDYLKAFTNNGTPSADFSVSTIGVLDTACKNQLNQEKKIGTRYMELSDLTGGTKNSLCSPFDSVLNNISTQIAGNVQAQFQLSRTPVVSSIRVIIDGTLIPQDAVNGWTYDAVNKIVTVHGTYSPEAGANIVINFDPESVN